MRNCVNCGYGGNYPGTVECDACGTVRAANPTAPRWVTLTSQEVRDMTISQYKQLLNKE